MVATEILVSRKPHKNQTSKVQIVALLLAMLLTLIASQAFAQPTIYEIEPNDTPAQATRVSGAAILTGVMGAGDQDGYLWTVTDVDAQKRLTFELQGIPGELTVVEVLQLEYAANGVDIAGKRKLFTLASRDGSKPAVIEDLIFEPGEYLLGVAHSGAKAPYRPPIDSAKFNENVSAGSQSSKKDAGAYRLTIREGSRLVLDSNPKPHGSKENAYTLRNGSEYAAFTETPNAWFLLRLSQKDIEDQWEIRGQVPVGRQAKAYLRDGAGKELAESSTDKTGKIAFPDLGLAAGNYYIELQEGKGGVVEAIAILSTGKKVEGAEAEPNDEWKLANRADLSNPVTGRMGKRGETDFFEFSIGEELAGQLLTLALETAEENSFRLCLYKEPGKSLQCRDHKGNIEFTDLLLQPGQYKISVGRGPANAEYTIRLTSTGEPQQGNEIEPNDDHEHATAIPANNRIKGRFAGGGEDTDFYRISVTEKPQLWRFQVIGDQIAEVAYLDSHGTQTQRVRPSAGQRRVRLENVYLLPGKHTVSVRGKAGGTYTLLAVPIGPPDPNGEREPNDDTTRMQPLRIGQTRTGLLVDSSDRDNYRFYLAAWEHIRLTAQPPTDAAIDASLYWGNQPMRTWGGSQPGAPVILQGLFPPGPYRLELSTSSPRDGEYKITLERLSRFACPEDCEPNDNPAFASPLPPSRVIKGTMGEWRDMDWYRFPAPDQATEILVKPDTKRDMSLSEFGSTKSLLTWDDAQSAYRATVPGGKETYLHVRGNSGNYRIDVIVVGVAQPGPPIQLPLKVKIDTRAAEVAAYKPYGQTVAGSVRFTNTAASPVTVNLQTAASDMRWNVELGKPSVSVPAGGTETVPLKIHVPSDAWANKPVRISVDARTSAGSFAEGFTEIKVGTDSPAVEPIRAWTIPEPLRGGFNVAWSAFGSRPTEGGRSYENLMDGHIFPGIYVPLPASKNQITIQLAGQKPVDVAGFAINTFGATSNFRQPKEVTLQLSVDGKTFEDAARVTVEPILHEQFFSMDAPQQARFARLVIHSTWDGNGGGVQLGEWTVIARPGEDLSGGKGFNIALPELGGHVVWADPSIAVHWDHVILTEKQDSQIRRLQPGQRAQWVVGFHHDRAARISRLEWVDSPKLSRAQSIPSVSLAISVDSPSGPWTPIGEWKLPSAGGAGDMMLKQPVWARFVKFTAAPAQSLTNFAMPETIRIWEQPAGADYRSILGEWGYWSQEAIFEATNNLEVAGSARSSGNDSRAKAAALAPGKTVRGEVQLGRYDHWYRMTVPAGQNTLKVTLSGDPTVRTEVELQNAGGNVIPMRKLATESSSVAHILEAVVDPGSTVYLRITEPPRNVAFVWDTSASVNAFIPLIYNALAIYAEGLVPGRDAANLVPFGRDVLLRDWYGEPYILQMAINDYTRGESSSDAERTLDKATQALAPRAGSKSIVLITDADTPRFSKVWNALNNIRPRIFALGVAGSQPLHQDLMEDWSRINGGTYTHLLDEAEMEIAFDRAASLLRQPAPYELTVNAEFRKDPGPGKLTVTAGKSGSIAAGGGAIELILDASGSMLQRIKGKRRIEIAKEVLMTTVRERIPAGTPLALRVFGNKQANSCRTDLEIPLGPLDAAKVTKTIQGINAMNLAKTPIADSLSKVASDLQQAKGRKVVVLVTDGEETCGGDPEKVLNDLRAKGIDVTLNIVGFAIGDAQLEESFQNWADLGGGRYFPAGDQKGLSDALDNALRIPYSVYDSGGALVGEGWVGREPLELPRGVYRVVVATSPAQNFDRVEITGGDQVNLRLK